MQPANTELNISVEELAMSLSIAGSPAVAKGLLLSQVGKLSDDEERGRLRSAAHALLARDLVVIKDSKPYLQDNLAALVEVMQKYDYSIRFARRVDSLEQVLAYYFSGRTILKHQNRDGVVQHFAYLPDTASPAYRGSDFL